MSSPFLIGNVYYLRTRVPSDLVQRAHGRSISLPVGDDLKRVLIKGFVKVSLGTREPAEAKRRFSAAHAALQEFWVTLREGSKPLTFKQMLALAGEARGISVEIFDEEPVSQSLWEKVVESNTAALNGRLNTLAIPTLEQQANDLEKKFGRVADAVLSRKGVNN
ncbi:DUF6538 domain-containing protein [Brucella sp.]|uniref:DUF6538 domain-containing protein n=1 Tax=Brucella sp. TaxID=52132 RepID=UPI0028AF824F|nr:DUF6538 domain-containing protein [Brucella sp.]